MTSRTLLLAASFVVSATSAFAQDPAPVQAVVTAGVAYLRDDHEDFTKNNGALLVSNDSRARASGLAGALFHIASPKFWGMKRQISVQTSLQFNQGASAFLDGFFLGGAVQLNSQLHATFGVGLNKGKELSPGFRQAAAAVIAQRITAQDPAYARFASYDPAQKDEDILDGLPLNAPGKDTPFFPGDPIVDSYNWSFFAGVSVPVAVTKLFEKNQTGDAQKSVQAPSTKDAQRRAR